MNEDVACWVELAEYDLETARSAFRGARYVAVLVHCQQSLEKLLKAIVVQNTGKMPPRIHNLAQLAGVAGVAPKMQRSCRYFTV